MAVAAAQMKRSGYDPTPAINEMVLFNSTIQHAGIILQKMSEAHLVEALCTIHSLQDQLIKILHPKLKGILSSHGTAPIVPASVTTSSNNTASQSSQIPVSLTNNNTPQQVATNATTSSSIPPLISNIKRSSSDPNLCDIPANVNPFTLGIYSSSTNRPTLNQKPVNASAHMPVNNSINFRPAMPNCNNLFNGSRPQLRLPSNPNVLTSPLKQLPTNGLGTSSETASFYHKPTNINAAADARAKRTVNDLNQYDQPPQKTKRSNSIQQQQQQQQQEPTFLPQDRMHNVQPPPYPNMCNAQNMTRLSSNNNNSNKQPNIGRGRGHSANSTPVMRPGMMYPHSNSMGNMPNAMLQQSQQMTQQLQQSQQMTQQLQQSQQMTQQLQQSQQMTQQLQQSQQMAQQLQQMNQGHGPPISQSHNPNFHGSMQMAYGAMQAHSQFFNLPNGLPPRLPSQPQLLLSPTLSIQQQPRPSTCDLDEVGLTSPNQFQKSDQDMFRKFREHQYKFMNINNIDKNYDQYLLKQWLGFPLEQRAQMYNIAVATLRDLGQSATVCSGTRQSQSISGSPSRARDIPLLSPNNPNFNMSSYAANANPRGNSNSSSSDSIVSAQRLPSEPMSSPSHNQPHNFISPASTITELFGDGNPAKIKSEPTTSFDLQQMQLPLLVELGDFPSQSPENDNGLE